MASVCSAVVYRGLRYAPPTAVLFHRDAVPYGILRYRGLRSAPPTAVLFHRSAVLCYITALRFRVVFCICFKLSALGF